MFDNQYIKEIVEKINLHDYKSNIEINLNKIIIRQNVINSPRKDIKKCIFGSILDIYCRKALLIMMQSNCLMKEQILENLQ